MHRRQRRVGAADHAAAVVAAGGDGVQADVADGAHQRRQLPFAHAVQLQRLAGGDAQGAVAVAVGEVILDQVLCGGHHAAGHLGADHEDVLLRATALARCGAGVAVLLLIHAVELEQVFV